MVGNVGRSANEPRHPHSLGVNESRLAHRHRSAALGVNDRVEQSLNAWDLDVLHDFIGVVFGEVGPEMARNPRDRAFEGDALADALIFLIRLAAG